MDLKPPESAQSEAAPRRTKNGHLHGEAFCLMWYQCKDCKAMERIWNSRDGVTPFGMMCASCGGANYMHVYFGSDLYAPDHKLRDGQRFWRDGTPEEAEWFMRRRIEMMRAQYPLSVAEEQRLIEKARNFANDGADGEFQKGWPNIDVHREFVPSAGRNSDG